VANGYTQLLADYGIYYKRKTLILAYIDYLTLSSLKDFKVINEAKGILSSKFDIKDLRECKNLFGIVISYSPNEVVIIS